MLNYTTKANFQNTTGADTSNFVKKFYLTYLKSDVDKLDFDKLNWFKQFKTNLSHLKNKVDKEDVNKLLPASVDLSKLCGVRKYDAVEKYINNAKKKHTEDKIPDIANLGTNTTLNVKIHKWV